MKVLINAISAKMGGSKVIINSFMKNIPKDDGNEYHFLLYKNSVDLKKYGKQPNVFIHESHIGDMNYIKRFMWYQFTLPNYIKENKFDFMINLTNYGPLFAKCKQIILIHNAKHISIEMKKNFTFRDKLKLFIEDIVLMISMIGADKIIVQTQYMKNGLIKKFRIEDKKIVVIPNAVKSKEEYVFDPALENKLDTLICDNENVISYISLYSPYKNFSTLISAIEYLKNNKKLKVKLILTLDEREGEEVQKLLKQIKDRKLDDYIVSVGNINNENVFQVLRRSKVFVFPSYAESFGMPFVEAMINGIPILASDLEFAHNVCGSAAMYFNYEDKKDIAEKIELMLTNNELIENLSKKALEQSALYDEKIIMRKYFNLLS